LEDLAKELKERKAKGKMIKDENEEVIKITSDTWKEYIWKYTGGYKLILFSNIAMILFTCSSLSSDYIIGDWTSQKDQLK